MGQALTGGIDEGPIGKLYGYLLLVMNRSWDTVVLSGPWQASPTPGQLWIMIERWTNERNDDGACIIGTSLAACFWIHTKAVEIEFKEASLGEKEKRATA